MINYVVYAALFFGIVTGLWVLLLASLAAEDLTDRRHDW